MQIMKKYLRPTLALLVLAMTTIIVVRYLQTHPEIIEQLKTTNPWLMILLAFLYCIWSAALVWVLIAQLKMIRLKLGWRENILLNSYSSLVNFFGPGQSGPGVRAVYLKRKHSVRLRDFTFLTLIYYACYAVISAAFLLIGTRPWWQTMILVLAAGTTSVYVIKWFTSKSRAKEHANKQTATNFTWKPVLWIFVATLLQLSTQAIIYGIELHSTGQNASIGQIISYTGAANFALFVSVTPGAIGIREAFLAFSTGLHGISTNDIITANIIDRAAYLVFLAMLSVMVVSMHAKKILGTHITTKDEPRSVILDIDETADQKTATKD